MNFWKKGFFYQAFVYFLLLKNLNVKITKDINYFALLTYKNNDSRRHLWEICFSDQVLIFSVLAFE